ncbi:MAG: hypothetical protein JJE22_02205 [Bacteroidia bacterium]|nr:hypothetical protein [Bacteroidia bacterium]
MKSKNDDVQNETNQKISSVQKSAKGIIVNDKSDNKNENKKKRKHSSSLVAASMYRSPVDAVRSNAYSSGGGDSTGINNEFQEK